MKKTVLLLMGITILSKLLGLCRDITLTYYFGASNITDIYLISLTIPVVILSFVAHGISAGYVPLYREIEAKSGKRSADTYTINTINLVMIICTIIFTFCLIFTNHLVKLFAFGFDGKTLETAVIFTRVGLLGIFFYGITYVLTKYSQIKNNFIIPGLIGVPYNIIIIVSILIAYSRNIYYLAIGSLIAVFSEVVILIIFPYRIGFRYKMKSGIANKYIQKLIFLSFPVILGSLAGQINQIVDRTLASQLAVGGISALSYAFRIDSLIQSLFITAIVVVLYPQISKLVAEDNVRGMKKTIGKAITGINLLVVPATTGTMIFAVPIVSLLFGRGAFNDVAITMTAKALFFYSIGMLAIGIRNVLGRAFYSLQDTKTPMIIISLAMGINIILNVVLSKIMGVSGLALATSISTIICMMLMFFSLKRKIGRLGMKPISISFLKILFASLFMGFLAKLSFHHFTSSLSQNLSLILAIAIGAISYFMIIVLMKIDDVDMIRKAVWRKLGIAKPQ